MSEKAFSSVDGSLPYTDEEDDNLYTWCWPYPPKNFTGPAKYTYETLSRIPTGSLYFSSRKGPLSEMSARITGSPYDMVGIIFQSRTPGREGTYVYTVDSSFLPSDRMADKVVVINLADLISDDTIIHHAVLPLKDFDEPSRENPRYRHVIRRSYEEERQWGRSLKEKRNGILKDLFRKYREMRPEHDSYQTLASMAGLPVAESLRTKNALTAAELVGLILFQAGLIWDDRLAVDNQNPVCCFDDCFFQSASEEVESDSEVVVNLMTPKTFTEAKYRRHRPRQPLPEEEKGGEDLQDYLHRAFNESSEEEDWTEPGEKGSIESDDEAPRRHRHSEPIQKPVHARTILFGSLRPVDFLRDYYRSAGVNPQDQSVLRSIRPLTGRRGASGELVAIIHALANQQDSSDDLNQLNMSWYHDNLIPIELDNNCDEGCEDRIESECRVMKGLIQRIDQDFVQKRMLHVGNASLSGPRLLRICRQVSEIAAELHALACECETYVRSADDPSGTVASDYNEEEDHQRFKVRVDSQSRIGTDYIIVLHKYMWGGGWKYDWIGPLKRHPDKHYEISCRMKRLLEGLNDLKNRTPVSCIILELIVCLLEQANALNQYITHSKLYCLKGHSSKRRSDSSD